MKRSGIRLAVYAATCIAAAGLTAAAFVAAAERSPDAPRITSFWPLSVVERLSGGRVYTHTLPPLFTRVTRPESDRRTLRPFATTVTEYTSDSGMVRTTDLLPPLGRATASEDEKTMRLFPLFNHRQWSDPDEKGGPAHSVTSLLPLYHHRSDGPEHHTTIFPVYTSGTAGPASYPIPFKSAKDYTAVFPLYGNLYGAFGNDRVTFAFWPLYTRIEKTYPGAAEPFVKQQFLWPILTVGSGGGYSSFKIWPVYGQTVKEGQYVSRFFAWPIFNVTKNLNQDTANAKTVVTGLPVYWDIQDGRKQSRSLFPFYGSRTTPDFERAFRLWPLFVETTYNKEGTTTKDFLWPIFSKTEGKERGFKVWPVFGVRKQRQIARSGAVTSEDVSAFFLWTLGKYEKSVRRDSRRVHHRLFPLYTISRYDDGSGYKQRQVFIWPFISYQEDTLQDAKAVSFLNLLGAFESEFPAMQEVYSPLWRIVDYARQGRESRLSILWNFVTVRKDGGHTAMSIGPFLQFHKTDTGFREYTLLSAIHLRARQPGFAADGAPSLGRQTAFLSAKK